MSEDYYRENEKAGILLEQTPNWVKRNANRLGGCSIPLTDKGYKELLGAEFCNYFLCSENYEGKSGAWRWSLRRVDELRNLKIWRIKAQ